jgi:hypothetical protein
MRCGTPPIGQRCQPIGDPVRVIHQQRNAGAASGTHRQRDDNTSAARIDA